MILLQGGSLVDEDGSGLELVGNNRLALMPPRGGMNSCFFFGDMCTATVTYR